MKEIKLYRLDLVSQFSQSQSQIYTHISPSYFHMGTNVSLKMSLF